MNKGIKIGIGVVALGGVATAIAVPIALHKGEVARHIDMNQEAWHGQSLKNLVDKIKEEQQTSGSIVTEAMKAIAFKKYDEEQKGSLKLQVMNFRWDIFSLNKEKKDLEDKKNKLNAQTSAKTIKTIDERLKKIDEKKTKINEKIAKIEGGKLTDGDYNSSTFSTDYPIVLTPEKIIEEKQKRIILDQQTSYSDQFATKQEGSNSWEEERSKKYNGATSNDQAATYLTYGIIKPNTLAQYKYKINDSYTYEQKEAEYDDNGGAKKKIFPFLDKAATKTNMDDDEKIYFISTESKNPDKIAADTKQLVGNKASKTGLAAFPITRLAHTLIGVKQNKNGASLAWDITKEMLIGSPDKKGPDAKYGLLSKFGTKRFYELLADYKTTGTAADAAEKTFIRYASQNGEGTVDKAGLLSIKPTLKNLDGMAPGFTLGSIEGLSLTSAAPNDGAKILDDIIAGLRAFVGQKTDPQVTQSVKDMNADEIKQTFGTIFRNAFGAKPNIAYKISNSRFITLSKFGIHIIKHTEYNNESEINTQIQKDLDKAVADQSTKNVELNYTEMFGLVSTDDDIVTQYLKDHPHDNLGYGSGTSGSKDGKGIIQQKDDAGQALTWSEVKDLITKTIESNKEKRIIDSVNSIIGKNVESFLVPQYDKGLLNTQLTVDSSGNKKIVDAGKIYEDATKLAGGTI